MKYKYSYSYKDLLDDEVVEISYESNEKETLDSLFLNHFIQYTEDSLSQFVSWEGKNESFPQSISELRAESATDFQKMEFKLISGQENLKQSRTFGEKS